MDGGRDERAATRLTDAVVVVDDDASIRDLVSLVLERVEVPVVTAPDGPSGLAAIRQHRPKVIVLDIMMPGMDGYEVCRQIRADESLEDVFIIFVTGLVRAEDESRAREVGGDVYLRKPDGVIGDELLAIVSSVFEGYMRSMPRVGSTERVLHYERA